MTCYHCGRKGHKKPNCRYYKAKLEKMKKMSDKTKKETKTKAQESSDDEETVDVASSVVLDELSGLEDILCTVDASFVNASYVDSTMVHALDMKITQEISLMP